MSHAPTGAAGDPGAARPRWRVLVVATDADLGTLVEQWLGTEDCELLPGAPGQALDGSVAPDLVVADLPFPSRAHVDSLRAALAPHGQAPIIVLSPTVFPSVDCRGPTARALGADALLPKPTTGAALRHAVSLLMGR